MFQEFRRNIADLLDQLTLTRPKTFSDVPFRRAGPLGVELGEDPPSVRLAAKYPNLQLPLEETMKLFKGQNFEELAAMGITQDVLQRVAFNATSLAQYQHYVGSPVSVDSVEVLTQRFATNLLKNAINYRATTAGAA